MKKGGISIVIQSKEHDDYEEDEAQESTARIFLLIENIKNRKRVHCQVVIQHSKNHSFHLIFALGVAINQIESGGKMMIFRISSDVNLRQFNVKSEILLYFCFHRKSFN